MKATGKLMNNDKALQILQWNRTSLPSCYGTGPSTLVAVAGFPLSTFRSPPTPRAQLYTWWVEWEKRALVGSLFPHLRCAGFLMTDNYTTATAVRKGWSIVHKSIEDVYQTERLKCNGWVAEGVSAFADPAMALQGETFLLQHSSCARQLCAHFKK